MFDAAKKKRQYPSGCQKRKKRENAIADTSKTETFCTRPSTTEAIHELSASALSTNENIEMILEENIDLKYSGDKEKNLGDVEDCTYDDNDEQRMCDDDTYEKVNVSSETEIENQDPPLCSDEHNNDYPSDKGHFTGECLNENVKHLLVKHGTCQPKGSFSINGKDFRIDPYYHLEYKEQCSTNISIKRFWLGFSPKLKVIYCHDCWLFSSDWTEGFELNTKNLARKIRRQEKNRKHVSASKIAYRWRTGNTIDSLNEKAINERVNYGCALLSIPGT